YEAAPERHHHVAQLLTGAPLEDPGPESLPDALRALMRGVGAPMTVGELGYGEDDLGALVEGALKQRRLLDVAPREPAAEDLERILRASL
ncbi:MAG TPA: iron-containing alcohol dehydrogenase, partial [Solirubrobacteraceae bacterium]